MHELSPDLAARFPTIQKLSVCSMPGGSCGILMGFSSLNALSKRKLCQGYVRAVGVCVRAPVAYAHVHLKHADTEPLQHNEQKPQQRRALEQHLLPMIAALSLISCHGWQGFSSVSGSRGPSSPQGDDQATVGMTLTGVA